MRKTYILIISIIILITIITFTTYAMFTDDVNVGEFVNLTASSLPTDSIIQEYERITIEAGDSKTIDLNITNSTSNSLYYGVWYEMVDPDTINSNISIGKLTGSTNATIGQLDSNGNTTVQIAIVNNSSDDIIINVGVGYSNTNSLNLSTGRSVITGEVASNKMTDVVMNLSQGNSWSSDASGLYAANAYDDNGVTKYHEYRYVGANVNNWVRFNDDNYRIIGVFDDNSHGVTGKWLVKLIMADTLTSAPWGVTNAATAYTTYSSYNNNWETANANILLNEYFLAASNTSQTYGQCSDWTYYSNNNDYKTKNCSKIKGYGIQTANLRNYIQPATWYLKGLNSTSFKRDSFYTCERSDTTTVSNCNSGNNGAYPTKVTNKSIGLMYLSDYLYATGYCSSGDCYQANYRYYGQRNWLFNGYEWTITPNGSSSASAFCVDSGYAASTIAYESLAIRPTFYLKSTIKRLSGDGTLNSPFIIG